MCGDPRPSLTAPQALRVVIDMLSPLHAAPSEDAEGDAEAELVTPDPLLVELASFATLLSKTKIGDALVCSECLGEKTEVKCLDGECELCGFRRFWSNGLRPQVLKRNSDGTESVRDSVSSLWEKQMSWDVVKPGSDGSDGSSPEKSDLRGTVSGTVTEFLDACEKVHQGWLPHRFHGVEGKASEQELQQTATPGILKDDSDWAENGEIVVKDQMQSEYWGIKYYSLLNSITSFLVSARWKNRESPLSAKAEVTVQPADAPPDSTEHVPGSHFAQVEVGSLVAGADVEYTVKRPNGETEVVPRHRLRHRVWHTVAFLGITNEKQHVALPTQTFLARQLEFWRRWSAEGREAALAFAACDRSINVENAAADAAAEAAETSGAQLSTFPPPSTGGGGPRPSLNASKPPRLRPPRAHTLPTHYVRPAPTHHRRLGALRRRCPPFTGDGVA